MVQSAVSARVCLPRVGEGGPPQAVEGLLGTKKSFIKLYS